MSIIDAKFDFGQTVYLKTDIDQLKRIVTGYSVRQSGISYALACGQNETWHYDFEISTEKDLVLNG